MVVVFVAVYISNKMPCVERDDLLSFDLEIVWCEIHSNCKKKKSCWNHMY
jgi:hypothetical protein